MRRQYYEASNKKQQTFKIYNDWICCVSDLLDILISVHVIKSLVSVTITETWFAAYLRRGRINIGSSIERLGNAITRSLSAFDFPLYCILNVPAHILCAVLYGNIITWCKITEFVYLFLYQLYMKNNYCN